MNYGICVTCWWGLGIWQKLQSVDLNQYISMQDGIIVIIVLIFYDLLGLLLSEVDMEVQAGRGTYKHFFQDK